MEASERRREKHTVFFYSARGRCSSHFYLILNENALFVIIFISLLIHCFNFCFFAVRLCRCGYARLNFKNMLLILKLYFIIVCRVFNIAIYNIRIVVFHLFTIIQLIF